MHPVVFSREWFAKHELTLLLLLAMPGVGRWLRWVLCIRRCDVGYAGRIVAIWPHAYAVLNQDGSITADVRTHAKYAKRLYYAFRPVWWALHAWDQCVANPFVPVLNAGFDTLTVYPDPNPETSTVDGYVASLDATTGESWALLRAEGGNTADDTAASNYCIRIGEVAVANQWNRLARAIFLFDTATLTSGVTVSATTLSLYGAAGADTRAINPDIDIYTSAPASNTALVASDFATLGTVSQTGGATLTYNTWNTAGYNGFAFNATGIGNVSKTSVSKFGARNAAWDAAGVAPTYTLGDGDARIHCVFADQIGTANDPKLVVTYALAGGASVGLATYLRNKYASPTGDVTTLLIRDLYTRTGEFTARLKAVIVDAGGLFG